MKVGITPENMLEQGAVAIGQVPVPSIETQASLMLAQVIITATNLGVFEALASRPLKSTEVAEYCQAHPDAIQKLLIALVNTAYLSQSDDRYDLAPVARKWLIKESETSLRDFTVSRSLTWEWLRELESFVRTGEPIQIHQAMSPEQWDLYHRGMRSTANIAASEVASNTPISPKATAMLDLGGSHGYFSVALCRRYPNLQAVILELPEAIAAASPLLEREGMGDRIVYQAGNALADDLGIDAYDLVLLSNFVHLFDEAENIRLFEKIARSLKSGGYLVVQKIMIPNRQDGQLGSFTDLFLALTSAANNWSLKEVAEWQKKVGLMPQRPTQFLKALGSGQQAAKKP